MKLAFIYGNRISSVLTRFFTGSTCYHIGFTDGVKFWDMNKIRRRRLWLNLYPPERVILVDCPVEVPAEYLEYRLDTDESTYGYVDYILFAFRWLYHLFGKSTRNYGGVVCSEMIAADLLAHGWEPVELAGSMSLNIVPSPADLELAVLGRKDAIKPL